ncbi:hypothetical protein P3T23_003683, partial [Paraburkholderia sp. GAS448]|uniref:hypothetical protein n=1 Tax=Paraburkholderia sp. GAS448 TaxID=3035136 RepID=UPI003D231691
RVKVGNRQAPLQHRKPHPQKVGFLRLRRFPGSDACSVAAAVSGSVCFSAYAICSSANPLFFTA